MEWVVEGAMRPVNAQRNVRYRRDAMRRHTVVNVYSMDFCLYMCVMNYCRDSTGSCSNDGNSGPPCPQATPVSTVLTCKQNPNDSELQKGGTCNNHIIALHSMVWLVLQFQTRG